jgi:hypothetical protein
VLRRRNKCRILPSGAQDRELLLLLLLLLLLCFGVPEGVPEFGGMCMILVVVIRRSLRVGAILHEARGHVRSRTVHRAPALSVPAASRVRVVGHRVVFRHECDLGQLAGCLHGVYSPKRTRCEHNRYGAAKDEVERDEEREGRYDILITEQQDRRPGVLRHWRRANKPTHSTAQHTARASQVNCTVRTALACLVDVQPPLELRTFLVRKGMLRLGA